MQVEQLLAIQILKPALHPFAPGMASGGFTLPIGSIAPNLASKSGLVCISEPCTMMCTAAW
jgi:hypothetical protein